MNYGSVSPYQQKMDLKEDFRLKFRNISQIMNCVSCERCRLWGKLQILGFGTAIKILLSTPEELENPDFLERSEIVAFINTLHQVLTVYERILNSINSSSYSPSP